MLTIFEHLMSFLYFLFNAFVLNYRTYRSTQIKFWIRTIYTSYKVKLFRQYTTDFIFPIRIPDCAKIS